MINDTIRNEFKSLLHDEAHMLAKRICHTDKGVRAFVTIFSAGAEWAFQYLCCMLEQGIEILDNDEE